MKPWTYRNGLGYQLRSQDDYGNVFKLNRFQGSHSLWKPFLAHILGFNAELITSLYEWEAQLAKLGNKERMLSEELRGSVEDISKIEGILLLKQQEAEKKQVLLNTFDFRAADKDSTKRLVDSIDEEISALNSERYSLKHNQRKVLSSLDGDQIIFNPEEAHRLFSEAGVLFEGEIKKDFEQLISFNRAITEERRGYLQEELESIQENLKRVGARLNILGKKRSDALAFLSDTDVFQKYRQLSDKMVTLRADIESLERQRSLLHRLQDLRSETRNANEERFRFQIQIENDVELQNADKASRFSSIRFFFSEIVEEVIDRKALLRVYPNKEGHLEFRAEILDESGNTTSADLGYTYRKLLCIAFDLAFLRAHLDEKFPRFVFHDGVFESLDDRKKEKLLEVIRQYTELGIQQIITLIDADMPRREPAAPQTFDKEEIVLTLHDENEQGRLFKTKAW